MSDVDVLVIGAGVAGALVAHRLALAGKSVCVIEAGSTVDRTGAVGQWARGAPRGLDTPYRTPEGDQFAPFPGAIDKLGAEPFKSTWVRRVGGSTWHWQGSAPRLIPSDFKLASRYGRGVDWPIDYADLEPWYTRAEAELGVSGTHEDWQDHLGAHRSAPFPMPEIWPTWSDRQLASAINGMELDGINVRVRSIPQARNSQPYQGRPPCAGNSSCIPICPIGAKYDASLHVQLAIAAGAELHERTVATRVLVERGRVTGVEVARWGDGEPARSILRAKTYVLAAHTIETARLLLISGVANHSGLVGRCVMDHPGGSVAGLSPEPWYPFRGPPVTSGIDDWRDGEYRREHSSWRLTFGNDGQGRVRSTEVFALELLQEGLIGAQLRRRIEADGTRLFRISWSTEQLPDEANCIKPTGKRDGLGLPIYGIDYRVGAYAMNAFPRIHSNVVALFERAKVSEVRGDPKQWTGSGHVLGTCRMGKDPENSVVDRECRSHDLENLFIVGGAVFPTVGTANPTLTIAALALRAAHTLESS